MAGFVHTGKRFERLGFNAASESNVPRLHPVCMFQHGAGMQIHLRVSIAFGQGQRYKYRGFSVPQVQVPKQQARQPLRYIWKEKREAGRQV
jgi:hypothetical protein